MAGLNEATPLMLSSSQTPSRTSRFGLVGCMLAALALVVIACVASDADRNAAVTLSYVWTGSMEQAQADEMSKAGDIFSTAGSTPYKWGGRLEKAQDDDIKNHNVIKSVEQYGWSGRGQKSLSDAIAAQPAASTYQWQGKGEASVQKALQNA